MLFRLQWRILSTSFQMKPRIYYHQASCAYWQSSLMWTHTHVGKNLMCSEKPRQQSGFSSTERPAGNVIFDAHSHVGIQITPWFAIKKPLGIFWVPPWHPPGLPEKLAPAVLQNSSQLSYTWADGAQLCCCKRTRFNTTAANYSYQPRALHRWIDSI